MKRRIKKRIKPRRNSKKSPSGSQEHVGRKKISKMENDPLLASRGSGRELWRDEHADEYLRRLREGWD